MSDVFPHEECVTCGGEPKFTILLTVDTNPETGDAFFHIPNQRVREMHGTGFDHTKQVPFCQKCIREVEGNLRRTIASLSEKNGRQRPQASAFE